MEKKISVIGNYHNHDASRIVDKKNEVLSYIYIYGTVKATCYKDMPKVLRKWKRKQK